jgi:hypothetical protein
MGKKALDKRLSRHNFLRDDPYNSNAQPELQRLQANYEGDSLLSLGSFLAPSTQPE